MTLKKTVSNPTVPLNTAFVTATTLGAAPVTQQATSALIIVTIIICGTILVIIFAILICLGLLSARRKQQTTLDYSHLETTPFRRLTATPTPRHPLYQDLRDFWLEDGHILTELEDRLLGNKLVSIRKTR